ncbi:MAG: transcriptional repressor [Proteobacteria bacterium]|nr:transcriptional repressor [Pseudomonadota bacterium]
MCIIDATTRLDGLLARLKAQGLRLTPQRVAIVRELVTRCDHPSVEQLHTAILAEFPTTSLATVYKTIHLLKEQGEVLELGFGELGSRYDGRRPKSHPHLICTGCGAISDPPSQGPELDELVASLAGQSGFAVSAHRFDLFGLCPACRKES